MGGFGTPNNVQTPLEISANPLKSLFYIYGGTSCMYIVTITAHQQRKMVRTPTFGGLATPLMELIRTSIFARCLGWTTKQIFEVGQGWIILRTIIPIYETILLWTVYHRRIHTVEKPLDDKANWICSEKPFVCPDCDKRISNKVVIWTIIVECILKFTLMKSKTPFVCSDIKFVTRRLSDFMNWISLVKFTLHGQWKPVDS